MTPVKFNKKELQHAFCSYLGTTQYCASTAQWAFDHIKTHSVFDAAREVGECPGDVWEQAMQKMRRLPYGGRWVHKARDSFWFWMQRATAC